MKDRYEPDEDRRSELFSRLQRLHPLGQFGALLGSAFLAMECVRAFTSLLRDLLLPIIQVWTR